MAVGGCLTSLVRRAIAPAVVAVGMTILSFAAARASEVTVTETGSTLIFPLFEAWTAAYAKIDPDLHMTISASGSGAGIAQALAKNVHVGASDAYISDNQAMANPHLLNIPLVISAQTVQTNLPELRGRSLRLNGPVLAGIYSGTVREWDASPLVGLNPGIPLPHHIIVPIRRADSSGDTFIFTQFLTFSTPAWENSVGYGTMVKWPETAGSLTAAGNRGMLQVLAHTPYAVGYLGISFEDDADKAGLITAMLANQEGKFLLPTPATISAAAARLTPRTPPDERMSLVFAPGPDSYPLINYEYALVSEQQQNPRVAEAISSFLLWCISPYGGSAASFLTPVHFIALPTPIHARTELQIIKIQ